MDSGQLKENVLRENSYAFALRVVNGYKHLTSEKKEYVLSKQLLRAGTSIGANVAEANQVQSRPDFVSKLCIALKEAVERFRIFTSEQSKFLLHDRQELIRILTTFIKTTRSSKMK